MCLFCNKKSSKTNFLSLVQCNMMTMTKFFSPAPAVSCFLVVIYSVTQVARFHLFNNNDVDDDFSQFYSHTHRARKQTIFFLLPFYYYGTSILPTMNEIEHSEIFFFCCCCTALFILLHTLLYFFLLRDWRCIRALARPGYLAFWLLLRHAGIHVLCDV